MRRVGLDWDASTVTEVEDGDRSATVAELLALAGLYAVPMTDLLVSSSGDFLSWPTCGALPPQLVRDLVVGLEVVEGPDGREIKRVKGGLTWLPGLIFSGATTGPEDWRPAADLWSLGKVSGKYLVVLGDRLRGVRRRRGLTLQEVEVATDQKFRASVLGAYERGERAMSLARFLGLARFYGVSPEELLPTDNQVRAWMGLFLPRAREASA
jgi:transcriptional regulator with XRE-family HTH domain